MNNTWRQYLYSADHAKGLYRYTSWTVSLHALRGHALARERTVASYHETMHMAIASFLCAIMPLGQVATGGLLVGKYRPL